MTDYTHVGTLRKGTHTVVDLGKTFEAGDEVPLTETGATVFADKFDNVHEAKPAELKAFQVTANDGPSASELRAAEKAAAANEAKIKELEKALAAAEKSSSKK